MNVLNQILTSIILVWMIGLFALSLAAPDSFGKWLKRIDDARYEFTMDQ